MTCFPSITTTSNPQSVPFEVSCPPSPGSHVFKTAFFSLKAELNSNMPRGYIAPPPGSQLEPSRNAWSIVNVYGNGKPLSDVILFVML